MKHVTIRGIRVPAARAKWFLAVLLLSAVCGLIGMYVATKESPLDRHNSASYFFIAARALIALAPAVILPQIVLPIVLILAPFLTAMFAMPYEPWTKWWFWPATVICEIVGGYLMLKTVPNRRNEKA